MKARSISERLEAQTERRGPDDCWRWLGTLNHDGYGRIAVGRSGRFVHRLAWELANKQPPGDAVIRHLCSHSWCVNPRHLRAGTHADNRRDTVLARRQARGSGSGRAKLRESDVRAILRALADGAKVMHLAEAYGVSPRAISLIASGKNWAHVHARPEQATFLEGAQS